VGVVMLPVTKAATIVPAAAIAAPLASSLVVSTSAARTERHHEGNAHRGTGGIPVTERLAGIFGRLYDRWWGVSTPFFHVMGASDDEVWNA
jgi:hypothetical protein